MKIIRNDFEGEVRIDAEIDIVAVRKRVREVALTLGFSSTDVTRIVTSASELARNIFSYAQTGVMFWRKIQNGGKVGLELEFVDQGPGISDPDLARRPGYSSGKGLGRGLSGAEKLMGEMDIKSEVGKGTTVTVRKWLDRH